MAHDLIRTEKPDQLHERRSILAGGICLHFLGWSMSGYEKLVESTFEGEHAFAIDPQALDGLL